MQVFIMHVGHPGNVDIRYTVTRQRSVAEMVKKLSQDTRERDYFQNDLTFRNAFPDGQFNCWGLPIGAEPAFERTQIGDLVLFIPFIGIHGGGLHQIGTVKAKAPLRCYDSSKILWPDTPDQRLFPFVFFFDTEVGFRGWFEFLEDFGYDPTWDPRGWYRRMSPNRFSQWGGPQGYLDFLRSKCGFRPHVGNVTPRSLSS